MQYVDEIIRIIIILSTFKIYYNIKSLLNNKLWLWLSIIVLAVIALIFTFSDSLFHYIEQQNDVADRNDVILPLDINLEEVNVLSVSNNTSVLEIKFKIHNPNTRSIILQILKYELYGNDILIHAGQIGERMIGMLSASNYFTILNNNDLVLKDKIKLHNNSQIEDVWDYVIDSDITWHVKGKLFFNLSSMTSGAENEIDFELYK